MQKEIKIRNLPPWWFIKAINSFRTALIKLNRRMFPAKVVLYEFFQYFWLLPCLRVSAEMDIAGLLKEKSKSIEELASETKSDPEYLFRMMRALASQQIFKQLSDGRFANTRLSSALIEGPDSLRYMIMHHLGTINWTTFNDLSYSVKHGRDAFVKTHGKTIYNFLSENPAESEIFDKSMTNLTELAIEPIISAYNFKDIDVLADIGGGQGLLLSSVLYKYPAINGILFDLEEGHRNCEQILTKFGVETRTKIRSGNFFNEIPLADAYILKHIIHNWSDHDAVNILKNISEVMPLHGKLLLIEMIIEEDNKPSFGKLVDVQMMVFMESGKERTKKEYESLLRQGELVIKRVIPTIAPFSIIEAVRQD